VRVQIQPAVPKFQVSKDDDPREGADDPGAVADYPSAKTTANWEFCGFMIRVQLLTASAVISEAWEWMSLPE